MVQVGLAKIGFRDIENGTQKSRSYKKYGLYLVWVDHVGRLLTGGAMRV